MSGDPSDVDLRTIIQRITSPDENPVTRARRAVEMQVPVSRRGPGWDRHWRELEAYLETPGDWSVVGADTRDREPGSEV